MIGIEAVVSAIFFLIIAALVFGLLWWAVSASAGVIGEGAQPFIKLAKVLLIILAAFVAIGILLGLAGHPIIRW